MLFTAKLKSSGVATCMRLVFKITGTATFGTKALFLTPSLTHTDGIKKQSDMIE